MARDFEQVTCCAELPWSRLTCPNVADGADGYCSECRDELRQLDTWTDERAAMHEAESFTRLADTRAAIVPRRDAQPEKRRAPRESREDFERSYGPHAARARYGR